MKNMKLISCAFTVVHLSLIFILVSHKANAEPMKQQQGMKWPEYRKRKAVGNRFEQTNNLRKMKRQPNPYGPAPDLIANLVPQVSPPPPDLMPWVLNPHGPPPDLIPDFDAHWEPQPNVIPAHQNFVQPNGWPFDFNDIDWDEYQDENEDDEDLSPEDNPERARAVARNRRDNTVKRRNAAPEAKNSQIRRNGRHANAAIVRRARGAAARAATRARNRRYNVMKRRQAVPAAGAAASFQQQLPWKRAAGWNSRMANENYYKMARQADAASTNTGLKAGYSVHGMVQYIISSPSSSI